MPSIYYSMKRLRNYILCSTDNIENDMKMVRSKEFTISQGGLLQNTKI